MAYMTKIIYPCEWIGCPNRASNEVFHDSKTSAGRYCSGHGAFILKKIVGEENVHKEKSRKS